MSVIRNTDRYCFRKKEKEEKTGGSGRRCCGSMITLGALGVLPINAVEQHGQLRGTQVDSPLAGHRRWEKKGPFFKTLVNDDEAVFVPVEKLDPIAALVAKHKDVSRERIVLHVLSDELRQAVKTSAHGGRARRQPNAHGRREAQHGGRSSRTATNCRRVVVSKPEVTRIVRALDRATPRAG